MLKKFTKKASMMLLTATLSVSAFASDAVIVGGKFFTEQYLLSEMTTQLLQAENIPVEQKTGMGSSLVRKAQEIGEIDLYWEYTGTSLVVYNKVTEELSPEETYQRVKDLDAKKGLIWLAPSNANNTFALAVRKEDVAKHGLRTLSDMAQFYRSDKELNMVGTAEFIGRPDGIRKLQRAYDFRVPRNQLKSMDSGLTYTALKDGLADVALVFATDGRIAAFGFDLLTDDKNFFPNYAVVPVIRKEALEKFPELEAKLNELSSKLDDATMQNLNASVDIDKKSVKEVATAFLKANNLL